MKTNVDVNRQTVLVAERQFDAADFVTTVPTNLIFVKPGTRILRGFVDITGAFTAGSLKIGNTVGPDTNDFYLGATSATAEAATPLVVPLHDGVIDTSEAITGTLTGTATSGAGVLHIEYVEMERSTEYNTYRG